MESRFFVQFSCCIRILMLRITFGILVGKYFYVLRKR